MLKKMGVTREEVSVFPEMFELLLARCFRHVRERLEQPPVVPTEVLAERELMVYSRIATFELYLHSTNQECSFGGVSLKPHWLMVVQGPKAVEAIARRTGNDVDWMAEVGYRQGWEVELPFMRSLFDRTRIRTTSNDHWDVMEELRYGMRFRQVGGALVNGISWT